MKKSIFLISFIFISFALIYVFSFNTLEDVDNDVSQDDFDKLSLVTIDVQYYDSVIIDMGIDMGFFERNKLEIDWTPVSRGASTVMISGEADVSFSGATRTILAYSEGSEVRLLAAPLKAPFDSISRFPKEEADKIKIVAVNVLTGEPIMYAHKGLEYFGADISNIEFVAVSSEEAMQEMFNRGEIDFVKYFPEIDLNAPNTYLFLSDEYLQDETIIQGLLTTQKVIDEKPEALEKFVKSIYEITQYIIANSEETKNFIREKYDYDEKYVEYLHKSVYLGVSNVNYVPEKDDIQGLFNDISTILEVEMKRPVEDFIYPDFALKAVEL